MLLWIRYRAALAQLHIPLIQDITPNTYGETNLPTEEAQACSYARIPRSHKDELGSKNRPTPPACRTCAPRGVNHVLKRRDRLTRKNFSAALKRTRRQSSPHFLAVFPFEGHGYAVVIAKKTVRLSVRRHGLKRRIYAILRELSLPNSVILFPKASAEGLSPVAMRTELTALLGSNARL